MRQLDFMAFIQNRWTNVTVRRGYKWADLRIGEEVALTSNGHETGLIGKVKEIRILAFRDIRKDDLKFEHDPTCRTRTGLLREMRRAYPDFSEGEPVVLVTYVRRGDHGRRD